MPQQDEKKKKSSILEWAESHKKAVAQREYNDRLSKMSELNRSNTRLQTQSFLPIDPQGYEYPGSVTAKSDSIKVGLKPRASNPKTPTPKSNKSKISQRIENLSKKVKAYPPTPKTGDDPYKVTIENELQELRLLLDVQSRMIGMKDEDKKAIEWSVENLDDPRSRTILETHGIKLPTAEPKKSEKSWWMKLTGK